MQLVRSEVCSLKETESLALGKAAGAWICPWRGVGLALLGPCGVIDRVRWVGRHGHGHELGGDRRGNGVGASALPRKVAGLREAAAKCPTDSGDEEKPSSEERECQPQFAFSCSGMFFEKAMHSREVVLKARELHVQGGEGSVGRVTQRALEARQPIRSSNLNSTSFRRMRGRVEHTRARSDGAIGP